MKVRNIEVSYKDEPEGVFCTRLFSDWYDFADFLKEEEQHSREITIRRWNYTDRRL